MENILTLTIPNNDEGSPARTFFRRTARLLLNPVRFFQQDFRGMEDGTVVAFGLTNAWLSGMLAFMVHTFNTFFLARLFENWVQRLLVSEEGFSFLALTPTSFLYAAGIVLLSPFFVLLRVLLGSLVVYLFTRVFVEDESGGPDRVTLANVMRIQSASLAGRWFSIVPVVGGFLSYLVSLILLVTGIRERFAISNRRAIVIVLAPYVLLGVAVLAVCLAFAITLAQLPAHELLDIDASGFGF